MPRLIEKLWFFVCQIRDCRFQIPPIPEIDQSHIQAFRFSPPSSIPLLHPDSSVVLLPQNDTSLHVQCQLPCHSEQLKRAKNLALIPVLSSARCTLSSSFSHSSIPAIRISPNPSPQILQSLRSLRMTGSTTPFSRKPLWFSHTVMRPLSF